MTVSISTVPARLLAGWALTLTLLAGCASAPDRYYTLASVPSPILSTPEAAPGSAVPPAARTSAAPFAIEMAPVAVPERLARPQMVLRVAGEGSAELRVLEQHRWASSFEQELRDALASGVAARLGAADVTRGGRAQGQTVWRIQAHLQTFDAVEYGMLNMRMQWRVRQPNGNDAGACAWAASESAGTGMDALTQGAQRLTARAAAAMAEHITALQAGTTPGCNA